MHELLRPLTPGSLVLDLGCARCSFDSGCGQFTVVRFDLDRESPAPANFVQGALYAAVPDARTVTDKLYRWLARGGGHVNQFCSAQALDLEIERATGFPPCTSLSFLNRRKRSNRPPRRLLLLGGGAQLSLVLLTVCFCLLDRFLGTRLSIYGWAFYFGAVDPRDVDRETWSNVCVRCGSGVSSSWLQNMGRVTRSWFALLTYTCPQCETRNLFTVDRIGRALG